MDIPKKDDIEREGFNKVVAEADLISGQIERAMKSDFKPGGELSISLPRWPSDEIQAEVVKRFEGAGWTVVFQKTEWLGYKQHKIRGPRNAGTVKVS